MYVFTPVVCLGANRLTCTQTSLLFHSTYKQNQEPLHNVGNLEFKLHFKAVSVFKTGVCVLLPNFLIETTRTENLTADTFVLNKYNFTMDPETPFIAQHLRSIVIHSFDTYNFRNAEFACERLLSLTPDDPDAIYLHASTLYRQGQYKAAYNRTSDALATYGAHLGCGYIFARLCYQLQRYTEGIYRLMSMTHLYNESRENAAETSFREQDIESTPSQMFSTAFQKHSYETNRLIYPDSSAVYHLLGQMYKAEGDVAASALNFQEALKFNVFDFEAFQELAKLGVDVSVSKLYNQKKPGPSAAASLTGGLEALSGTRAAPSVSFGNVAEDGGDVGVPNPFSTTPRQAGAPEVFTPRIAAPAVPDAPLRRTHDEFLKPTKFGDAKSSVSASRPLSYMKKRSDMQEARTSLKRGSLATFISTVNERLVVTKDVEAAELYLRRLYTIFAKLYKSMCKYDCYKAIRMLESLPDPEKDTPWVLSKLGRLHYEIVNYKQSKKFFVRLRQLDRTRLEDMEYYSTLLWHLHKNVELTFLANELHDIDENLAITWCVMGNLFSLTREPDEAIRCFNKSIAIDSNFTYAHTLKGHEYFGTDNYERALDCFRISLMLDPRHYNAYYGIGMVYINLGDFQKADYHFRKAVSINPINIILICCVGMVLEKLGKKTLALRQYELANKLQPLSALPIFKKAQLLFSMQQFPQALKEFELVKELAPNEASVHFLLGQLYNIKNDKFLAIREFTIALNLDPKGNYLIREAMEMLKEHV